jgi:hypothetical protein
MKYFTPEWWSSGCEGADDVFGRYQSYLESVKGQLPQGTLAFDASHTLHDSVLKSVACDFEARTTQLTFLGWDTAFEKRTHYRLFFGEIALFEQSFPQQQNAVSGRDDVGYWEWEALPGGTELRLLFASDAMFRLRFKEFSFEYAAAQA